MMTTSRPGNWQTMPGKSAPELLKQVSELQLRVASKGALSAKTKTLMIMG